MATSKYLTHGDWILKELTLRNFAGDEKDIRSMFRSISFTEDIFSNVIHGKVLMVDGIDFPQFFPIIGQEELVFRFTTDNNETDIVDKRFRVYRMGEKQSETNTLNSYYLYFTSKEALDNENVLISKSFKNKKISFLVEDVFGELDSDKSFDIDSTKNSHHLVIPNWTPFQCINWCASIASSDQYEGSMFLFYENKEGYNFKHLETLIGQDPTLEYEAKVANTNSVERGKYPARSIVSYKVLNTMDTLDAIHEGLFGTRVVAYDNVSKQIREFSYSYQEDFESTRHLSGFKLVTDEFEFASPTQRTYLTPTKTFRGESNYFGSNEGQGFSERREESLLYRSSMLSQISSLQLELGLFGDSRLTCGQTINIVQENKSALKGQNKKGDKLLRGKALLTRCRHVFSQEKYEIHALAMKDSYEAQPEFELDV